MLLENDRGEKIERQIWFNAPAIAIFNGTVKDQRYRAQSEYERYIQELTPLIGALSFDVLTDSDLEFLHHETAISFEHLNYLRLDAKWSLQHKLISAVLYGLFRQGFSTNIRQLLAEKPSRLREALKRSIDEEIISAKLATQVDEIVDQLINLAVLLAFVPEEGPQQAIPVGAKLKTAPLPPELQRKVVEFIYRYEGDKNLWEALAAEGKFEQAALDTVRFTLESSVLVFDHLPMLEAIQTLRQSRKLNVARDLAQLKRSECAALVQKIIPRGLPDGFENADVYAEAIADRIEQAFPTAVVAHRLAEDPKLSNNDINYFFQANPDFDLLHTPIQTYLKNEANLSQVKDRQALTEQLKKLKRLALITPEKNKFVPMQGLYINGLDSSFKVNAVDEREFHVLMAPYVDVSVATKIRLDARARVDACNFYTAAVRDYFHGTRVLPGLTPKGEQATWEKLFGSLSSCSCKHCRSVYSPAAYMVDLLEYLRKAPVSVTIENILVQLLKRRPDLEHILLNCDNANTPLPYIDLVNEILELKVTSTLLSNYQTEGSSELDKLRLRALPQYQHDPAYTTLSGADYPWILPFNLVHEETKVFSQIAEIKLFEIFELFNQDTERVARAHLGISQEAWSKIAIPANNREALAKNWGVTVGQFTLLDQVPEILARSDLSYQELESLIDSPAFAYFKLAINRGAEPCNIAGHRLQKRTSDPALTPLNSEELFLTLDLIHRFVRLQRALGWTIERLSHVLNERELVTEQWAQLPPVDSEVGQLDLVDLSKVIRLATRLRLSIEKTAQVKNRNQLARALGKREAEISYLIELSGVDPFVYDSVFHEDKAFVLAKLETLLDYYELLNDADLDLAEVRYLLWHRDLTPAVFEPTNTTQQAWLQNLYEAMQRSSTDFPPTGIDLVADSVRVAVDQAVSLYNPLLSALTETDRNTLEVSFRNTLERNLRTAKSRIESRYGDRIATEIAAAQFESTVRSISPTPADPVLETMIKSFREQFAAGFFGMHAAWWKAVQAAIEYFGALTGISVEHINLLLLPQWGEDGFTTQHAVLQALSSGSDVTIPAIEDFLGLIRRRASSPGPKPLPKLVFEGLDESDAKRLASKRMLIRLTKSARLIQLLRIIPAELSFIDRRKESVGSFGFNNLPYQAPDPDRTESFPHSLFTGLLALVRTKLTQTQLPQAEKTLFDFMELAYDPATTTDMLLSNLAEHTGWNQDPKTGEESTVNPKLLNSLQAIFDFTIDQYRFPDSYALLKKAVDLMNQRQIPANALPAWLSLPAEGASPEKVKEIADASRDKMIETARTRYASDEDWYKAITLSQDSLRERKRDALVAYLLHHLDLWLSTEEQEDHEGSIDNNLLYSHFLIDVEMSACQLTSRIVQANSAIQLFVQRCLMNLEISVQLGDTEKSSYWQQWTWMKNYRVWEANRKVFLYPENWIEPDLRDDKSPFFKELENELLQGDVTQESVERAYASYFGKLDDVARLDIRGFYEEDKGNGEKTLHVVGRAFSEPHIYYYRKRFPDRTWTAWEKIELNIEGESIILLVHKGRLMLFWPKFRELQFNPNDDRTKAWEINLNWSEYDGKWQAAKVGTGKLILPFLSQNDFTFRLDRQEGQLNILVYQQLYNDEKAFGNLKYIPDSHSLCRDGFTLNMCTGEINILDEAKFGAPRILIHPDRVDAKSMQFLEDDSSGEGLSLNQDVITVDTLLPRTADLISYLNDPDVKAEKFLVAFLAASSYLFDINSINKQVSPFILLNATPGRFSIVPAAQFRQFTAFQPFFLNIDSRSYLVLHRTETTRSNLIISGNLWSPVGIGLPSQGALELQFNRYQFENLYHPFLCEMVERFNELGVEGILGAPASDVKIHRQLYREGQLHDEAGRLLPVHHSPVFENYGPTYWVWRNTGDSYFDRPYEQFDFSPDGAYSIFNWEVFFHIPLLIADRLSKNQRFAEAQRWFHYIFNPTDISNFPPPAKFWQVKPLFELAMQWGEPAETLEDMLQRLAAGNTDIARQVEQWRNNPFNPHLIARLRLVAYQKTVVFKYLDNLIVWGDYCFQQDTMESINKATQLYILASEILGPRPITISQEETKALSYSEIQDKLDEFSNFILSEIDSSLPPQAVSSEDSPKSEVPPNLILYFCLPGNEKLASYWDTVADRLFKVRHCMNIEGQVRQLPLFAPPIDPALLVRAQAMGLDLRDVIGQALDTRPSLYRYQYISQKALEFCNEVRSLGGALLAALEKMDAEELSLIRSRNELSMLKLTKLIKTKQIAEANETLEGLQASRKLAEKRFEFYSSREFMSANEVSQIVNLSLAHGNESVAQILNFSASIAHAVPDTIIGPCGGVKYGGTHLGHSLRSTAAVFSFIASQHSFAANMSSIMGGHERRKEEWQLQAELAQREIDQIDKQILAAEIRLNIAELDQANHEKQTAHAEETDAFLRSKFTNTQLYSWMAAQISALHYQSYRLACDLAKKAEQALKHELGLEEAGFIQFGHWDSMKKGLLAGERLALDLKRMEAAYLDQNKREYELVNHISLRQLDPIALLTLKATASCEISLPEWLFDLDTPGHYMRRIKNISLSIPAVTGSYTSINCTLSLQKSTVRRSPLPNDPYSRKPNTDGEEDSRFVDYYGAIQSIVTSNAQNDSGLFETNLRDERFLPFEGHGAVSTWKLELPSEFRQFDYLSISDVILHMRYTAREGGDLLKRAATSQLQNIITDADTTGLIRLFSLRHDFPSEWHRFVNGSGNFEATINKEFFPYFVQGKDIKINSAALIPVEIDEPLSSQSIEINRNASQGNVEFTLSLPESAALLRNQDAQVFLALKYTIE